MKKQLHAIAILAIVGLVWAPRPALAQVFKVGSFTKSTGTAPASQMVAHNLGVTPKALILWTSGNLTGNGFANSYWWGFGVTDGTTSRSTSSSSQNAKHASVTQRRAAAKALTTYQYDGTSLVEGDMQATAWDATNFYLTWTTNNATAYVINFIAIGGSGVSAKVVDWMTTNPNVTGNVAVTGVGFQPDAVLHFQAKLGGLVNSGSTMFMLGAMDAGGDQWATTFAAWSNGSAPSVATRAQRTDACIEQTEGISGMVEDMRASFYSMDANGFTVNFTQNTAFNAPDQIFSLALKGLNVHAGSFNKSTGAQPASQPVAGVTFQPAAVLLTSFQDVTRAVGVGDSRLDIGASDGTTQRNAAIQDMNNVAPTNVQNLDDGKVFRDNNGLDVTDPEADLTSLDADGFTLNWTTNDAVATEILYLAFAPLSVTAVTLESFRATRLPDGGTRIEWRTGYEVDNVGFRIYREQNGQRVRVTTSLVPGSALIGLGRGASAGTRTYSWSDATLPPEAGPAQYWLEDVDLKGKSTWHGPIVAGTGPSP